MIANMATLLSTLSRLASKNVLAGARIDGRVNDHYEKLTRNKSRDDDVSKFPNDRPRRARSDHNIAISGREYWRKPCKPKSRHPHVASAVLGSRK
jgi:hypothetical protein